MQIIRRWSAVVVLAVGLMALAAVVSNMLSASRMTPTPTAPPSPASSAGEPRLLTIEGDTLDGQRLQFPRDFAGELNLVVMPFDREQQTNAVNWLAAFQQAAAQDARVEYYSIAALEDLSPVIRSLVFQGLNLGVREEATRQRVVIAFLTNQEEFVRALAAGDTSQMRVLIVARDGRVLWQTSGGYTPEAAAALTSALASISR